jgi:HK97 family phage major capsid protein
LAQASITPEQKQKLDEIMSEVTTMISELEAADDAATNEQLSTIFSKAVETLNSVAETSGQQMEANVQAMIAKLQAKIEIKAKSEKKFSAKLSLLKLKANKEVQSLDGHKPYSAGVDVTAWTPESEIDNVEIYRPVIGVVGGFTISSTNRTSVKVRKFGLDSGACAIVVNHGIKPELITLGSQTAVEVSTYAGVVKGIADEDLEDNPGLEAEIQNEALENLASVENDAAIVLLKGVASTYANVAFGTKVGADEKTAIIAIIDMVQQKLGRRVSEICFALNSSQWALLGDLRNSNGTPIPIDSIFGNVTKIVDNTLANDEFICWAKKFAKFAVYKSTQTDWYKGVQVVSSEGTITTVTSEWQTDESSVRVRQRQVMYVSDATTVVKGTISGVKEAITEVVQP